MRKPLQVPEPNQENRDLARLENGYLFIVGRTKELIVRFGENVYPAEVEAVLNSHPAVVRSAVIGRAVEGTEGGEEVVAFVQLVPSLPTSEAELAQHAAQHLAPYKRPSQILLVPSMPLTLTGKVVKAELAKIRSCPLTTPSRHALRKQFDQRRSSLLNNS
jgi:long-chain acyl-CoA synthetase